MCTTHKSCVNDDVTLRKVWIVNKQKKHMKILKVKLTVNAPEINFNEYQNTQKKFTIFSFNLSKIPKTKFKTIIHHSI